MNRSKLHLLPPILAVVLLALLGVESATRPSPGDAAPYHAVARRLATEAPREFGGWVGQDVETPPAAVEMLRPNVLLSRAFHYPETGRQATFLLVQTKDARDMGGHYPRNCYPAHGWKQIDSQWQDWTAGGLNFPGTDYHFVYRDGRQRREPTF